MGAGSEVVRSVPALTFFYLPTGPIDQRQVVVHCGGKNGLQVFH